MNHALDLPAVIKALSDVPPERHRFVGVMIVLLVLLLIVGPVCLIHFFR